MDENKLFDPNQHGSRTGRSTVSQMIEHPDEILNGLENNMNVDVIYINLMKANGYPVSSQIGLEW